MGRKNSKHYVDNKEMLEELRQYKKTGKLSEELGEMFMKIATRFASLPKFSGYSYRDDMVSSAIERMVTQAHKFDPDHPAANPFAYFTQTAYRQFLIVLKCEKKQRDIKSRYRQKVWDEVCENENMTQMQLEKEDEEDLATRVYAAEERTPTPPQEG